MHRFWGLTRRQTIGAFVVAALGGVAIAVVLQGNAGDERRSPGVDATALRPGKVSSSRALWVFGFSTLRFAPDLRRAGSLTTTGFGSVAGTEGRVYMYDATSGRVGALTSATNELVTLGTVTPGQASNNVFVPAIALEQRTLWLVSAPGRISSFDLDAKRQDRELTLGKPPTAQAGPVGATAVAVDGTSVVAVYELGTDLVVARIDPATNEVGVGTIIDGGTPAAGGRMELAGFAVGRGKLWVVTNGSVLEIDADTLATLRRIPLDPGEPTSVKGAVVAGRAVWVLADNGATLVRVDTERGAVSARLTLLPSRPAGVRLPAGLAAARGRVWALVQRSESPTDRTARLVVVDARRAATLRTVDIPSSFFAGALAGT